MRPKLNPINHQVSKKGYLWSFYFDKEAEEFLFIRSFDGDNFTHKISNGKTSIRKLINSHEKNHPHFKSRHLMYK